ncbi:hypothetical protein Halhy_5057 [Haliscomenobacter hydrossis DSM 1100]|uniref:Uncharacterized protein n=2 Tax=Haliscomenobacter TaxID=2349 RepID=F4L2D0_HALH1|nr:hypothetical protein Halhy_5057 [Haliscomenobacter hydrossis DSM 1100]
MILKTMNYSPKEMVDYNPDTMGVEPLFKAMRVRSWKEILKKFKYVSIAMTEDIAVFSPSKRNDKYKSYSFSIDENTEFSLKDLALSELGQALLDSFANCK